MSSVAAMARALLYLRVMSLAGRVKSRLLRLKQPKYLAGALVGAAYVYLIFIRRAHGTHPGPVPVHPGSGTPADGLALLPELSALMLFLVLAASWVIPRRASLAFSEAEIAFLFPAPVNRRMLVHYRLLGSQLNLVFSALVLTLVFRRGQAFGGNAWFHAIGWWVILATLDLHFTGTSFVYSKLLNRGMTSGPRKAAIIGTVLVAAAALIAWAWAAVSLPQPGDLDGPREFARYVSSQLHAGPLPWLLAIPALVVAPYLAGSASAFVLALGPALAVLLVHYFWVAGSDVSFEEASIARAEKRAARTQRVRQGDWRGQGAARKAQKPPFDLRDTGQPEVAFLWKNLLSTSAFFRPRVAFVTLAIVVGGSGLLVRHPALGGARLLAAMAAGMLLFLTLLVGPMMARQDLRADLPNSDILKTYPLHGWQIVLGELLAPLSILSGLTWMCLLAGFLLLPADTYTSLTPTMRGVLALGLAVLAPPLLAIQLLVPNAAAVVFPAWARLAGDRTERGIEAIGQRIIFTAGQWLIIAVAAVPALIGAALVFFLTRWLVGAVAAAALAVAAVFVLLCCEAWQGVRWLGARFERFDLSAELRP